MSGDAPLGFGYQVAAGAVAGVSEVSKTLPLSLLTTHTPTNTTAHQILIMYPLDVVKTRVQLQGATPIPGQDHYTSMVDCFRKIYQERRRVPFISRYRCADHDGSAETRD